MSLFYVGSPYSKYAKGKDAAFEDVTREVALLFAAGIQVVGAITMSHPIYRADSVLGGDWKAWQKLDLELIDRCDGVIVVRLTGWMESEGLQAEIKYALSIGKIVHYMSPGEVPEALRF